MTTMFTTRREDGSLIPIPESVARCKAAGFDLLDLSMCFMNLERKHWLIGDDWEERTDRIIQAAQEHGVTFCQSHAPFRSGLTVTYPNPEDDAFFRKMVLRSVEITARIGAPWTVLHPVCDPALGEDTAAQLELNHRIHDEAVDLAHKLGVGIAYENMIQLPGDNRRFGSQPEDLIALADDYHSPLVGLCWDFGHGNLTVPDTHAESLRMLGNRVKLVHITDNLGLRDDHFLPFQGLIPWEELMPVLKQIGFPGTLDLEINLTKHMPDKLKDEATGLAASAARLLQKMAEA